MHNRSRATGPDMLSHMEKPHAYNTHVRPQVHIIKSITHPLQVAATWVSMLLAR